MKKVTYYTLVVLRFLLAVFMINGGLQHFLKADFYVPFVPSFLPFTHMIILLSGVLEIVLGVLLFFPRKISKYGGLAIFLLMIAFLPVHIYDLFSSTPAIGTHKAAWIRFFVQFIFIGWAWAVYRFLGKGTMNNTPKYGR